MTNKHSKDVEKGSFEVKVALAEMLKGGVIMDVTNSGTSQNRRRCRRSRSDGSGADPL